MFKHSGQGHVQPQNLTLLSIQFKPCNNKVWSHIRLDFPMKPETAWQQRHLLFCDRLFSIKLSHSKSHTSTMVLFKQAINCVIGCLISYSLITYQASVVHKAFPWPNSKSSSRPAWEKNGTPLNWNQSTGLLITNPMIVKTPC